MLEGITVLNQYVTQVKIRETWGFSPAAVAGILCFVMVVALIIIAFSEEEFVLLIFGIIPLVVGILCWHSKPIYQECMEYKGTIEDTVSLNEFNEKYIIISKEGKLYTFRERAETELYE